MSNNIDMSIKRKIETEDCNVPETYFMRVDQTLKSLPDKGTVRKGTKRTLWPVAVAACLCILLSGTVMAAVNYYQQRMQSMSQDEKNNMIDTVQSSQADADSFSRSLTEEENKKMDELNAAYLSEGQFPQDEIIIVESRNMVDADTVTFIVDESLFALPERALTDEEILEIIDFVAKRDYSLLGANLPETNLEVSIEKDAKEKATSQAITLLNKIYGIQIDDSMIALEADENSIYRLKIQDEQQNVYSALYDLDEEMIVEIGCSKESDAQMQNIPVDEVTFIQNGAEILKLLKSIETEEISDFYCDYNYKNDDVLERGIVSYVAVKEDGICYVVKYNFADNTVTDMLISSYKNYQETIEQNASKRDARGIQRNRIEITINNTSANITETNSESDSTNTRVHPVTGEIRNN